MQNGDGSSQEEAYEIQNPSIVIGGFVMGNRFTEPTGLCSVTNKETGHKCELEVKSQYNGKASDTGKITGSLKDENE